MAIANVVTRGFGPSAAIKFVVTRGYSIGAAPTPPTQTFAGKVQRQQKRYFIELPNGVKVFGTRDKLEGMLAQQRSAYVPTEVPKASVTKLTPIKRVTAPAVVATIVAPATYFDDEDEEEALMLLLNA